MVVNCFLVHRQLSSCCLNTRELSGVSYKFTLPSWLYHLSEAPPSNTTALGIRFKIRILKEHIRSLAVLICPLKMAYIVGVGNGQGGLACCDSWGRKESDTTKRLNWTELTWTDIVTALKYSETFSCIL